MHVYKQIYKYATYIQIYKERVLKENALLKADSAALKELRQKEKLLLGKVDARENELRQMRNRVARAELLESENSMLKKQNAELEKFDAVRKKLQETSEQLAALKSRAESAEKLKKLLLRAEARNAEKQAELDKAGRLFAASEQLKKELMAQKRENSAVRLELSRTRAGMDRLKMQKILLICVQKPLKLYSLNLKMLLIQRPEKPPLEVLKLVNLSVMKLHHVTLFSVCVNLNKWSLNILLNQELMNNGLKHGKIPAFNGG